MLVFVIFLCDFTLSSFVPGNIKQDNLSQLSLPMEYTNVGNTWFTLRNLSQCSLTPGFNKMVILLWATLTEIIEPWKIRAQVTLLLVMWTLVIINLMIFHLLLLPILLYFYLGNLSFKKMYHCLLDYLLKVELFCLLSNFSPLSVWNIFYFG